MRSEKKMVDQSIAGLAGKENVNGSGVFDDDSSGETSMSYTTPVLLKCLLAFSGKQGGSIPGGYYSL
jgi:hypothetical protein